MSIVVNLELLILLFDRLYQKNPDNLPEIDECTSDVDELIRVTISVMAKREIQGGNNRTSNNRRSNSRRGRNLQNPCILL